MLTEDRVVSPCQSVIVIECFVDRFRSCQGTVHLCGEDETQVIDGEEIKRVCHRNDEGATLSSHRNDPVFQSDLFGNGIDDFLGDDMLAEVSKRQLKVDGKCTSHLLLCADLQVNQRFTDLALL